MFFGAGNPDSALHSKKVGLAGLDHDHYFCRHLWLAFTSAGKLALTGSVIIDLS
jgi:hypothetical protein